MAKLMVSKISPITAAVILDFAASTFFTSPPAVSQDMLAQTNIAKKAATPMLIVKLTIIRIVLVISGLTPVWSTMSRYPRAVRWAVISTGKNSAEKAIKVPNSMKIIVNIELNFKLRIGCSLHLNNSSLVGSILYRKTVDLLDI